MNALAKIQTAGFTLSLAENGSIKVVPFSKLTPTQLDYLKAHKAEIIAELKAANDATTYPRQITAYTPNGAPLLVMAKDAAHEAWLLRVNPKPKTCGSFKEVQP